MFVNCELKSTHRAYSESFNFSVFFND